MIQLLLTFSLVLFSGCTTKKDRVLNQTVVKVNDSTLTAIGFGNLLSETLKPFDALMAKDPINIKRAKESVIQNYIHEVVVKTWAKKNKISVNEEELDKQVDDVRAQYPDDTSFRKSLASAGIDISTWRDQLRKTLLEKKVFDKIREEIHPPTVEEMRSYYNANKSTYKEKRRVRLKQILVEKEDDARKIRKGLVNSKKFESFAPKQDDTGWIEEGTLEVFDRAFRMKKGAWSAVLKSVYGYHIYRVEEFQPARQWTFEEAKDKIRRTLLADREQAAYSAWLEDQARAADVYRNDSLIDSVRVETIGEK